MPRFDTAPLEGDLSIINAPMIRLRLSADAPVAQIAVRLTHVHPDGASTRITYGVLNLARHLGRPLVPGQVEDIELALDHIAYTVPAGHQLRVAISTAYWPLIWPSPTPVTLDLYGGTVSIAALTQAGDWAFPPPDAAPPWQTKELRPETHTRRQEIDMVTCITSLIIEDDFGKVQDTDHGLINGSIAREHWSIHPDDPLSAHGTCHWTDELERDDIALRTEAKCEMWSDSTHFHLTATIEAFENGTRVYHRAITDKIARDLL